MVTNLTEQQIESRISMMEKLAVTASPKDLPAINAIVDKLLSELVRRDLEAEKSHGTEKI